jgi:hypothetical protein
MVSELVSAVLLIFLVLAFYRLFKGVDQNLAVLVVIFGGVMPAIIYFVNVVSDAGALMVVRGADFLSVFDKPQRDALVMLFLRLHDLQFTATLMLAGAWLFLLGVLVYRSRFLPRFLGVWLVIAGCGWLMMCSTGFLSPQYQDKELVIFQPASFGSWRSCSGSSSRAPGRQRWTPQRHRRRLVRLHYWRLTTPALGVV